MVDLLAIGAHPDDCELFAGGFLASAVRQGHRVAALDLTRGEAASRGTPDERQAEALEAAGILGLDERVFLDLGDAGIENTADARRQLVEALRRLRPRVVATHHPADRHPDHARAQALVRECCFFATVAKFAAAGERLDAPPRLIYFLGNSPPGAVRPDFVAPLTDADWETRCRAVAAYKSQFHNPAYSGEGARTPTLISSREYQEVVEARARVFGQAAGAKYGEAFTADAPLAIPNLLGLASSNIG